MTKAIEARRELLANAAHLSDRYENECGPETDQDLASQALEHAVATRDYLEAEEAQPLLPIVQLSPDHPIAHAKVSDYDHWIGFVCQKIDRACGFEVDVKARAWGDGGPTRLLGNDAQYDRMLEAVLALGDEFRALEAPLAVTITGDPTPPEPRVGEDGTIHVTEPYTGPVTIGVGSKAEAKAAATALLASDPTAIALRSCWECNGAHEHLRTADYVILCFVCGHAYYKGVDITDGAPDEGGAS